MCAIVLLNFALSLNATAAEASLSFTAPSNGSSYAFSVPFQVNETEPYSGIQFKLNLSSTEFLSYTFAIGSAVTTKAKEVNEYKQPNDPFSFGFWCGSNEFGGDLLVGTLEITYTGSAPQTIAITEMKIVRVDEGKNISTGTIKPSPVNDISVSRDSGGSGNPIGPSDSGQTTSKSEDETIEDTETPLAAPLPFDDVHEGDWFYDDVVYVYETGLMYGTGATKFSPNMSLTRGMLVTILGKQYGIDIGEYPNSSFSDVDNNIYYAPYIEWARQNEVVFGIGDNKFAPDRIISRQDLATILHRYAGFIEFTLPVSRPYTQFVDENDIAAYAKGTVQALYSSGVISGRPGNIFDPKGTATRAEAAAMLRRFLLAAEG